MFAIERDLAESLQVIRAIRNVHIPVNKLPPEVLCRVLQHRNCGQDLVVATHVCRYWRSTLISSPALWTSFQFRSTDDVDRALAYLKRSKSVTIDIRIALSRPDNPGILRHFAPHMPRTRSLVMEGAFDLYTASSLLLCNPVPSLEHLEMRTDRRLAHAPENFLGRQAPLLRSAVFDGIFPALQSPFPLPSLTHLDLRLLRTMDPLPISSLLRLCSSCPRLLELHINIPCAMIQDVPLDRVVSLDSLVKLEYNYSLAGRFLPFLRLPHLKWLQVSSTRLDKLADLLPQSGHILLSGVTKMSHFYDGYSQVVELSGEGVYAAFSVYDNNGTGPVTSAEWFSGGEYIPFGQIEDLEFVGQCISADFPIHLLKNVTKFKVTPWDGRIAGNVLRLLHPRPGAGVPCPSLRFIEYTLQSPPEPYLRPLINMARARALAGYRLELLDVLGSERPDPYLEQELRVQVGALFVCISRDDY